MKTGRNEPCPCGSGKKYKNCHAEQSGALSSSNRVGWIVTAVVAAGAITLLASLRDSAEENQPSRLVAPVAAPAPVATPMAQPPGPAPAGKVWSPEHGHWHDVADSSQIQMSTTQVPTTPGSPAPGTGVAQPPGPAPAGKVWSPEHGHWHDAPGAAPSDPNAVPAELQPYMKPPGVPAAPAGAVWSEEHKHWHKADEEAKRKAAQSGTATTTQAPAPQNP